MNSAIQYKRHNVVQGESFVSADPTIEIATILGSCVSICLFDPENGIGGLNHYLLANTSQDGAPDEKYGIHAFEVLLNSLLKLGADKFKIRAKVFGGASMKGAFAHVGPQNAKFALMTLQQEGIKCVGQNLGGEKARKLRFYPTTGDAQMLLVPRYEEHLAEAAQPKPAPSSVELF